MRFSTWHFSFAPGSLQGERQQYPDFGRGVCQIGGPEAPGQRPNPAQHQSSDKRHDEIDVIEDEHPFGVEPYAVHKPEQPGGQYDSPADPRARKRPRSAERTIEQGQHEASKDDFFDQIGIARVEKDALKGKSLRGSTHGIVAQCDETDERQDADIDEGDGKRGGARFPGPADLPAELRAQKANEKQAPDEIERFALPVPFEFGKEADRRQREANEVDEKQQRDRKSVV